MTPKRRKKHKPEQIVAKPRDASATPGGSRLPARGHDLRYQWHLFPGFVPGNKQHES